MKLYAECIACQVRVRYRDLEMLINDEEKRISIMKSIVEYINDILSRCRSRYDAQCNPTVIATNLFRYVKKVTGVEDPYRMAKKKANIEALELYEKLKNVIENIRGIRDKLYLALKISLVGNLIDLGVAEYKAPEISQILDLLNSLEVYGDVGACLDLLLSSRRIAMILDNAGEAVLDGILAEVLRSEGRYVVAIVKGGAFQNDITINDVDDTNLKKSFNDVVDTGADASSIFLNEVENRVIDVIRSVDVVIAKGMANYEYISSIEAALGKPVVYMLMAKCNPVAKELGVALGKAVIKISNAFDKQ